MTGNSQHGCMKGKQCLNNLVALYDEMTGLVEKRRAVDVVYLDFSKGFNTVSCNMLTGILKYGLGKWTVR